MKICLVTFVACTDVLCSRLHIHAGCGWQGIASKESCDTKLRSIEKSELFETSSAVEYFRLVTQSLLLALVLGDSVNDGGGPSKRPISFVSRPLKIAIRNQIWELQCDARGFSLGQLLKSQVVRRIKIAVRVVTEISMGYHNAITSPSCR